MLNPTLVTPTDVFTIARSMAEANGHPNPEQWADDVCSRWQRSQYSEEQTDSAQPETKEG